MDENTSNPNEGNKNGSYFPPLFDSIAKLPPKPQSMAIKKRAIDMRKIKTVAKDNLNTTFQGNARKV